MVVRGIDISSHQGNFVPEAVPYERAEFIVIKVTGGGTYVNQYYNSQLAAARVPVGGKRRIVGHYHYAHELTFEEHQPFGRFTPEQEADHFLTHADVQPGDFVALDIEDNDAVGDLSNWATRWLTRVESALGFKPFIYSYPYYLRDHGLNIKALGRWPLWYASYVIPYSDKNPPTPPSGWNNYTIWQWSGGTSGFPGFRFDTDENVFLGTHDDLLALGKPGLQVQVLDKPTQFQHAEGFLAPMDDHFNWGPDSAGIIVERQVVAYNDEKRTFYRGTWRAATGRIIWEVIP